jgi:hypothetical protein
MSKRIFEKIITGVADADPIMLDHYGPSEISLQVSVSGTVTYTVRSTLDDVLDPAVTPVWFDHPDLTAQSASLQANYAFKPRFIQLRVTAGTGTAKLTVLQAGAR